MQVFEKIDKIHQKNHAQLAQLPQGSLPISYMQDTQNVHSQSCGILDCKAFEIVRLQGKDTQNFLNGVVTSPVLALEDGHLQQSLICQHKGKILTRIDILQMSSDSLLIFAEPNHGQFVIEHLEKFHIQEDVRILPEKQLVYCLLLGENVENLASQLCQNFQQCFWTPVPFGKRSACYLLSPKQDYFEIFQTLLNQKNIGLIGFQDLENQRIDELIPKYGTDYEHTLPEEASLASYISYRKGCYLGQETHARMKHLGHPNKKLMGLQVPLSVQLQKQDLLFDQGKEVGIVTSVSQIKHENYYHAIASVKYACIVNQQELSTADGQHTIQICPLSTDH